MRYETKFVDGIYYRATLCVSAVFAVARGPSVRRSVCLSVRLSRSCIVSRRLKTSSKFFLGPVVLFDPERRYLFPRGIPSAGAQNTWVGKICDFQLKSPFITETVRNRPMIAVEYQYEVTSGGSICVCSDDLE